MKEREREMEEEIWPHGDGAESIEKGCACCAFRTVVALSACVTRDSILDSMLEEQGHESLSGAAPDVCRVPRSRIFGRGREKPSSFNSADNHAPSTSTTTHQDSDLLPRSATTL